MVLRSPAPTHARTLGPEATNPTDPNPQANSPVDPRWIAVAGASALSLTAVFTKLADASVPTVVFYRCLLAVVPLALLAWLELRRHGAPPPRTVALYALGGAMLGLDFALWTQSIMLVGAGIATILNNVQVLVVPLLAWAFFRDRIPLRFVLSLPVMFIGISLAGGVFGSDSASGESPLVGTLLGLASGVAYAVYIIIIGRNGTRGGANSQVLISTVSAGVVGTLVGTLFGGIDFAPGWGAIGWLAALALVGQVLGWVLIGTALPRLPAQVGASLLLLQPALAVVFAMVLVHERPAPTQLLGCAVVIAVVAAVSRTPGGRPRGTPTAVDVSEHRADLTPAR